MEGEHDLNEIPFDKVWEGESGESIDCGATDDEFGRMRSLESPILGSKFMNVTGHKSVEVCAFGFCLHLSN